MKTWFGFSLLTLLLWGLWAFLPKLTTRFISPRSALIYEVAGGVVVALIVLVWIGFRPEYHPAGAALGALTGFMGFSGALCFLFAVSRGKASVVVAMTALYPLIAILLSRLVLSEAVTLKQGTGIVLALIAVVLLAG